MIFYMAASLLLVPVAGVYEVWCRVVERSYRRSARYRAPGRHRRQEVATDG